MAKLVEKFEQHRRLSAQKNKEAKAKESHEVALESRKIRQCNSESEASSDSDSIDGSDFSSSSHIEDRKQKAPEALQSSVARHQSANVPPDEGDKERAAIIAQRKWGSTGSVVPPPPQSGRAGPTAGGMLGTTSKDSDLFGDPLDSARRKMLEGSKDKKYLAFKKDLTESSRIKILMEEFEYSLVKVNLATQQILKELMQNIVEKMTTSAWEKVQASVEAAEGAQAAQKEAKEMSNRAKEMQTNCMREVTTLRDQLDENRKVEFAMTPIAVWEPLDNLDSHTRDLVLSCVEEKFKECLAITVKDVMEQKDLELEDLLAQTRLECDQAHEQMRLMESQLLKAQEELEDLRHRGDKSPKRRQVAGTAKPPETMIAHDMLFQGFMCVGSAIHSAVQSRAASRVGSRVCSVAPSRRTSLDNRTSFHIGGLSNTSGRGSDSPERISDLFSSRRQSVDGRRLSQSDIRRASIASIDSTVHTLLLNEKMRHSYRSGGSESRACSMDSLPENPDRFDSAEFNSESPYRSEGERLATSKQAAASFFPNELFSRHDGKQSANDLKGSPSNNSQQMARKNEVETPRRQFIRQTAKRDSIAVGCSEFTLEDAPEEQPSRTKIEKNQGDTSKLALYAQRVRGALSSGRAGVGWRGLQSLEKTAEDKQKVLLGVGAALEREVACRKQELGKGGSKIMSKKQHNREPPLRQSAESRIAVLSGFCDREFGSVSPGDETPRFCQSPAVKRTLIGSPSPALMLPSVISGTVSPFDDFSPKAKPVRHSPWEELPTPKARPLSVADFRDSQKVASARTPIAEKVNTCPSLDAQVVPPSPKKDR